TSDDGRIDAALQYASTIKCDWNERSGSKLDELVPALVAGTPSDDGTTRFERELRAAWLEDRPKLLAALQAQTPAPARTSAAPAGAVSPIAAPAGPPMVLVAAPPKPSAKRPPDDKDRTKKRAPEPRTVDKVEDDGGDVDKDDAPPAEAKTEA